MESRKNTVFPGIFIPINETLRSKLRGMKPSFGLKQLSPDNDAPTVTADKTAAIPPQRRTRALSETPCVSECWSANLRFCQSEKEGCPGRVNICHGDETRKTGGPHPECFPLWAHRNVRHI